MKNRINLLLLFNNWAFTRYDRRTDRSVRPRLRPTVCQTSRTDRLDRL